MFKKIILISIFITLITTGLIEGIRYIKTQKPIQTGAIIIPLTKEELGPYDQMYELLDKGIISQDDFEIQPIKQKRIFNVKLKSPADLSKIKFEAWLKENNYDKIPKEKFIFVD